MSQIVIDIPAIPLTEALLALIVLLLWRMSLQLADLAASNRLLAQQLERQPKLEARQESIGRAPSPTPPECHQRPVAVSAELFEQCVEEVEGVEGVQVPLFIAACKNYCEVLHIIGPFTMLTVREVNANMAKIETSLQLDAVAYRSMRALLTAEVDAGSPVV